jgi:putative acetyltransferase
MIRAARFPEDIDSLLEIWREYVASTSASLDYQGNDAEFAALPGKYAPPDGRVLLAEHDGLIIGCVAFRKVDKAICEMKRLYVRPTGRGLNLGRMLVERLIIEAKEAGYVEMRLDVLYEFKHARKLYEKIGFIPAEPVSYNPILQTSFLGLALR